MSATPMTVDFTKVGDHRQHASGNLRSGPSSDPRPVSPEGKLLTTKQIRARARRRLKRGNQNKGVLTEAEFEALYKPLEEWDMEELARGRPRDVNGHFTGRPPKWVTRHVYEQSMERYKLLVKESMQANAVDALTTIRYILNNDNEDKKGRPMIPASTKLDAAKFLLEHVVGKPTQRVESDISVRLQSILGVVMANPNEALAPSTHGGQGYELAHLPGHTIPMGTAVEGDDEILEGEIVE